MLRRLLFAGLWVLGSCGPPPAPTALPALNVTAPNATATADSPATAELPPAASTTVPSYLTPTPLAAATPTPPANILAPFLSFEVADGEVIALNNATIIDGTGAPPRPNWTVLMQGDRILDVGADVQIPGGARVLDLAGQTVIPGLFDFHAHLYSSDGRALAGNFVAYPRLHLAAGVTTIFSPGDFAPQGAVELREQINRGEAIGPHVLTAGPYFEGPSAASWMRSASTAAELRAAYSGWRTRIDGVKVYTHITEDQLAALIEAAHADGLSVTGHLASVPAGRAIELGIDGLEHGLFSMSEFFPRTANFAAQYCALAEVDMASPEVAALVDAIVANGVYVDPTFVVFAPELADFEPIPPDWDRYVTPLAVPHVLRFQRAIQLSDDTCLRDALAKQQTLVRTLHSRGGLIVPGTDAVLPVVLPGYGLHRELQYFVEAGLTPLEAIRAGTLDAATALGLEDDRGTIAPGQRADLVILEQDPSSDISAIGTTVLVFKDGWPYNPIALRSSVEGLIGIP
jgi:imidazolonepropionase-like amidohydrolase